MHYRLIGMDKEFHNRFKDSLRTDVDRLYLVFLIKTFFIIVAVSMLFFFIKYIV